MVIGRRIGLLMMVGILGFVLLQAPMVVYAADEPVEAEAAAKPELKRPVVKVRVKGKGLIVKWKKQKGIKSYRVYRKYKKSGRWKLMKKGIPR